MKKLFLVLLLSSGEVLASGVAERLVGTLQSKSNPKPYFGSKLTVELSDMPAEELFRFFGDQFDFKVKLGEGLQGRKISVQAKGRPWDQVFDGLLKKEKLRIRLEAGAVLVSEEEKH